MPKRRVAEWFHHDRVWYVRPPGWPKNCELSFTSRDLMVDWSHQNGIVLKDMRSRGGYNGKFAESL